MDASTSNGIPCLREQKNKCVDVDVDVHVGDYFLNLTFNVSVCSPPNYVS